MERRVRHAADAPAAIPAATAAPRQGDPPRPPRSWTLDPGRRPRARGDHPRDGRDRRRPTARGRADHGPGRGPGRRHPDRRLERRPSAHRWRSGSEPPARRAGRPTAAMGPAPRRRHPVAPARGPRRRSRHDCWTGTRSVASTSPGRADPGRATRPGSTASPTRVRPSAAASPRAIACRWTTSRMTVLWPIAGKVPLEPPDGGTGINNVSIVLLGTVGSRRFLLAGDVEEEIDPSLLARRPAPARPAEGRPPRQPHGDDPGVRRCGPAPGRDRLRRHREPVRPSDQADHRSVASRRRRGLSDGPGRLGDGDVRARRDDGPRGRRAARGSDPSGAPVARRPARSPTRPPPRRTRASPSTAAPSRSGRCSPKRRPGPRTRGRRAPPTQARPRPVTRTGRRVPSTR